MRINNQALNLKNTDSISSITCEPDGSLYETVDEIVREHFIDLIINEQLVARLVCTPDNIEEMIVGRLITEQYVDSVNDIDYIYICEFASRAKVFLKETVDFRYSVEREPTCCTGNRTFMKIAENQNLEVLKTAEWKPEWIFHLAEEFKRGSRIHKKTQGTHSCYLAVRGEVIFCCEDLGRHNALDKAIGYALIHGYDLRDCEVFITGRVPTDIAKKAIAARIPILISKAVPTDEAVRMAKYYNLTLICKAWPDKFEIYNRATKSGRSKNPYFSGS